MSEVGKSAAPEISVVVPMYNEADNLPGVLLRVVEALEPLGRSFEVVAVDDGSTDNTEEILRDVLGYSGEEIHRIAASGAVGELPKAAE